MFIQALETSITNLEMSVFTLICLADKFVFKMEQQHEIIVQILAFPSKNSNIVLFTQLLICQFIVDLGIFLYFRNIISIISKRYIKVGP